MVVDTLTGDSTGPKPTVKSETQTKAEELIEVLDDRLSDSVVYRHDGREYFVVKAKKKEGSVHLYGNERRRIEKKGFSLSWVAGSKNGVPRMFYSL